MLDLTPVQTEGALQLVRLPANAAGPRGAYAVATGGLVLHRDLTLDEARALLATMAAEHAAAAHAPRLRTRR